MCRCELLILLYMCPHAPMYVSSYSYICVLMLLYVCPHTPIYVSSCSYVCVLMLLYLCVLVPLHICYTIYIYGTVLCSAATLCVLILLYIPTHIYIVLVLYTCPRTTICDLLLHLCSAGRNIYTYVSYRPH
jgi:hypothetical protein